MHDIPVAKYISENISSTANSGWNITDWRRERNHRECEQKWEREAKRRRERTTILTSDHINTSILPSAGQRDGRTSLLAKEEDKIAWMRQETYTAQYWQGEHRSADVLTTSDSGRNITDWRRERIRRAEKRLRGSMRNRRPRDERTSGVIRIQVPITHKACFSSLYKNTQINNKKILNHYDHWLNHACSDWWRVE